MKRPGLHAVRRSVQIGIALAFIVIPWLNHLRINIVFGNFLCFNLAGLPLADPLAALQITLKNGWSGWRILAGAGVALGLAAVFGTVFCSWICPFGLMSEFNQRLAARFTARRTPETGGTGFRIKLFVFCAGLMAFLALPTTPVLNQLSLPGWYSRIFQFIFEQGHFSLSMAALGAVLLLEGGLGRRLWCRYVCPQSVLLILAKQISRRRLKIVFRPEACICRNSRFDPCVRACSLGIDPKKLMVFPETACTNCGDCVEACRKRGKALTWRSQKAKVQPLH